jgi:hypothetical protein
LSLDEIAREGARRLLYATALADHARLQWAAARLNCSVHEWMSAVMVKAGRSNSFDFLYPKLCPRIVEKID